MKTKTILCFGLVVGLLAGCETEKGEHSEKHRDKQARLMAEAKISKETAEQTALAKVPNGTIKESEIEREHGKLQWSFDMATPDAKDITEVNVDAVSGEIISVAKESPESEAKESNDKN